LPEVLLTRRAEEDLRALPRRVREAIAEALTLLAANPSEIGKELRGRLEGLWAARVGNYRILYTIEAGGSRVIVRAIRHRAVVYRRRRR
jgi:mRNA interferase RelE/StbE